MKFLSYALAAGLLLAADCSTQIAAAKPAPKPLPRPLPKTLSFNVTARIGVKQAGGASAPQQTIKAKVYASGNRVRVESQRGGTPIVFLYAPPYAYQLLPSTKVAMRYRTDSMPVAGTGANLDVQKMLGNPAAMRALLKKRGARHMATSRLSGVLVDLYTADKFTFLGETYKARSWLRRSDALPLKLELTSQQASVNVSWHNYLKGRPLSSQLFTVPQGYSIKSRSQ